MKGFTLIELLVVLAIIAILATISYPMYGNYVTKSRRADGQAALLQVAQELERCFTQFARYNDENCPVVVSDSVEKRSDQGYYVVTATGVNLGPTSFLLTAVPRPPQNDDSDCGSLTLNHIGLRGASGEKTNNCW